MPLELSKAWAYRSSYFDNDRQPLPDKATGSLAERIDNVGKTPRQSVEEEEITLEELEAFERLLRSMLALKAEDRISAPAVWQSDWKVRWVPPQLSKIEQEWRISEGKTTAKALAASNTGCASEDTNAYREIRIFSGTGTQRASEEDMISKEGEQNQNQDAGSAAVSCGSSREVGRSLTE